MPSSLASHQSEAGRPQSRAIVVRGLRLHYLDFTPESGGRPVMLLHGLASNARIWERVALRLSVHHLAPIAPDLRGHGLSDRPDSGYDFSMMTDDIRGLVEALGLRHPVMVGHSLGGALALNYAARFGDSEMPPSGVVLVDGGIGQLDDIPGVTWEQMRDILTPPKLAGIGLRDFLERLRRGSRKWRPDDEAVDIFLANFDIAADGTISPRLTLERHMRIVRELWDFKTYDRFAEVRCPVLMIPVRPQLPWDDEERGYVQLKERGVARAKAAITNLHVRWMEDSIHDLPLQRPEALAQEIIPFIQHLA